MDVHQKDKNINSRQQRQPQSQSKSNATYRFDDDASQSGTGAGQVPPRPPRLVSRLPGPTPLIAAPNSTDGGMSQGPPPDNLVDPSPVNQSEQSPPQSAHHSLPSVNMSSVGTSKKKRRNSSAGSVGSVESRAAHYIDNIHTLVAGEDQNLIDISASAKPTYATNTAEEMLDVISHQAALKSVKSSKRKVQSKSKSVSHNRSYQRPRNRKNRRSVSQQPQQPQQVPVTPPSPKAQPHKNSRASWRSRTAARSSKLRIVDPNSSRDVLTGEEVPPSAVVTPTAATPPEIVAAGVVPAPVVAADEVEKSLTTASIFSKKKEMAPSLKENTNVSFIHEKVKAEEKTILPTVVASPTPNTASYKEIGNTGIKYTKENPLGKGAFGDVYRGIYNDEQVAVKKLLLNRYEKEEREVNLQQNLDHENVLKILKVEEDDDFRYIVLELCAGTLGEVIDKTYEGPAFPSDPIVLYQIADGLDYIHSQKLIHRDIKPENILISMNGQQLKLSDFGLSKQISNRDTCSMSGMKGTLLWMAPELRGDDNNKATPKCDVFPCGCVFFVFLTRENGGMHPFGDMKDHLEVQLNIRSDKPININKLKADHYAVPVIRGMIKANPLERINLADVKERLRPFSHPDLRPSTTVESVKSTSLNYKDDQRTPVNPEGKRIYERNFLLELQNSPASKKKPGGLPSLEIVRDKASTKMKRGISVGDFARSTTE